MDGLTLRDGPPFLIHGASNTTCVSVEVTRREAFNASVLIRFDEAADAANFFPNFFTRFVGGFHHDRDRPCGGLLPLGGPTCVHEFAVPNFVPPPVMKQSLQVCVG
jgi:hypothetical protein